MLPGADTVLQTVRRAYGGKPRLCEGTTARDGLPGADVSVVFRRCLGEQLVMLTHHPLERTPLQ